MNKFLSMSKLFPVILLFSAVSVFTAIQSCNVSTANLSDVRVCSSLTGDGDCSADTPAFPGTAPAIYCSAKLKNAPSDTKVTFSWKRGSEDMGTAAVETGSGNVNSSFKPNAPLEPGKYSVTVKIQTDNATPITKEFTIE